MSQAINIINTSILDIITYVINTLNTNIFNANTSGNSIYHTNIFVTSTPNTKTLDTKSSAQVPFSQRLPTLALLAPLILIQNNGKQHTKYAE